MKEDQNRILIVEDEEDIRNLLIFNLKRNNFLIESTSNSQDALELIRNRKFDLICNNHFIIFFSEKIMIISN